MRALFTCTPRTLNMAAATGIDPEFSALNITSPGECLMLTATACAGVRDPPGLSGMQASRSGALRTSSLCLSLRSFTASSSRATATSS